jgi:outer membrane lipoprotein
VAILLVLLGTGCTSRIVPPELQPRVNRSVAFEEIIEEPMRYRGEIVVLGGVILAAKNLEQGTELEILQKPLSRMDEPKDVDISHGRFIALYPGYLETTVYKKGRKVTIVGEVYGKEGRPLGEILYSYPLLKAVQVHLWPVYEYHDYPPYWYDPYYYSPYWYGRPYYRNGPYPYYWRHPYSYWW